MSGLAVIKPGMQATVQDWGRHGQRLNGLSTGGAMDEHAFLWANRLLDNAPGATAIEITVGMCVFESGIDSIIAICGADMGLTINGKPAINWSTHRIGPGDTLKYGSARSGLRAYLAIAGGFRVKPVFRSASTVVRESLGGLNGGALSAGDLVPADSRGSGRFRRTVPSRFQPRYPRELSLRFIPSYQYPLFSRGQQSAFSRRAFTASQRMDRMGCRIEGEGIEYEGPGIISEGIAPGSIQVPPDGQPIILLKDCGTVGGYPKLGCVTRMDLNKLAQCRPGNTIHFTPVDLEQATSELVRFYRFFKI